MIHLFIIGITISICFLKTTRDVKTLNFLVNNEFRSKVCDFGLARFNTANNLNTFTKVCGTVPYLAPEVYTGEPYSAKADIFR